MTTIGYSVQVQAPCPNPACEGGVVYDPAWREWYAAWAAHAKGLEPFVRLETARAYTEEHPEPEGPEESPCPVCKGRVTVTQWVPLEEFARLLSSTPNILGGEIDGLLEATP